MGWLKKVFKPVAKAIDPLLPESVKKADQKILGGIGLHVLTLKPETSSASSTDTTPTQQTGTITEEEAQAVAQKRLARLGKYFTSPLGVLGNASTAAQKVFS